MALSTWLVGAALAVAPEAGVADEEVEVVADEPSASSASVAVIEVATLPASTDLAGAVAGVPGTAIRRLGGLGDWASVSIRGSAPRQVEVYLDGVPLNPEGTAIVNLSELPLRAFERVEVYRGNAPPELGGSPIGGVVNLVTGDPDLLEVAAGGGSWGTVTAHGAAVAPIADGDVLLIADGFRTRGRFPYLDDRGTAGVPEDDRERLRWNNDALQGTLHLRARRGEWTVLSAGLLREAGVPGFTWSPVRDARFRVARELVAVGWDRAAGATRLGALVWGSAREERLDDPAGELGFTAGSSAVLDAGGGGRFTARWAPVAAAAGVGAIELRGSGLRSVGGWFASRRAAEATLGGALRDRRERVAVTPVLQTTGIDDAVVATGERVATVFGAPRLGLLVAAGPRVALAANVGRYLRPPDLLERFGDQGVLVGNPALRPERGVAGDLGVRLAREDVRFEALVFTGNAIDRIGWVQNAQGVARPENLDRVLTRGAEAATEGSASWLRWTGAFTWTRATQRSDLAAWDLQPVPGIPELAWHHRVGVGNDVLDVAHTLDASSGTPLDAAGIFRTAPRWLLGASARGTWRSCSLNLDVLNLLDRRTETTPRDPLVADGSTAERAVTDFFGYPLPGRTFLVTVRVAR